MIPEWIPVRLSAVPLTPLETDGMEVTLKRQSTFGDCVQIRARQDQEEGKTRPASERETV